MMNLLCEEGFIAFALEHYDNPQCTSLQEFYEDLDRIKYLKRLINRLDGDRSQRNRLILNHLTVFINVFGVENGNRILFFRMEQKYHSQLKTYLQYLNTLHKEIPEVVLREISLDNELFEELRRI
jgi:hypothetical protein